MTQLDLNRGKFKELVVYLAMVSERAGDEGFGMVKLNKLLYRSDFEAFRLLGKPITGATYEKQEFGPVARMLPILLDELAASGRLYWQRVPRGPHVQKIPTMRDDDYAHPDMSEFTRDEMEIIDRALQELATYGGKRASDWSHEQSAGWNAAPKAGDEIPYGTAFISTDPIPVEDQRRATEFLRAKGWIPKAS